MPPAEVKRRMPSNCLTDGTMSYINAIQRDQERVEIVMMRSGHIRLLIMVSFFTVAGLGVFFPLEEGWCARLADGEEQAAPSGTAVQPIPPTGRGADRRETPMRGTTSERPVGERSQPAREGARRPAAAAPAKEEAAAVLQQPQSQPALPPQPLRPSREAPRRRWDGM